jgi:hypothetical protein
MAEKKKSTPKKAAPKGGNKTHVRGLKARGLKKGFGPNSK